MAIQKQTIIRREDGSIDTDRYVRIAAAERRATRAGFLASVVALMRKHRAGPAGQDATLICTGDERTA